MVSVDVKYHVYLRPYLLSPDLTAETARGTVDVWRNRSLAAARQGTTPLPTERSSAKSTPRPTQISPRMEGNGWTPSENVCR